MRLKIILQNIKYTEWSAKQNTVEKKKKSSSIIELGIVSTDKFSKGLEWPEQNG